MVPLEFTFFCESVCRLSCVGGKELSYVRHRQTTKILKYQKFHGGMGEADLGVLMVHFCKERLGQRRF